MYTHHMHLHKRIVFQFLDMSSPLFSSVCPSCMGLLSFNAPIKTIKSEVAYEVL